MCARKRPRIRWLVDSRGQTPRANLPLACGPQRSPRPANPGRQSDHPRSTAAAALPSVGNPLPPLPRRGCNGARDWRGCCPSRCSWSWAVRSGWYWWRPGSCSDQTTRRPCELGNLEPLPPGHHERPALPLRLAPIRRPALRGRHGSLPRVQPLREVHAGRPCRRDRLLGLDAVDPGIGPVFGGLQ